MKYALLCTLVVAAGVAFGVRSDVDSSTLMWGSLLGTHALLSVVAVRKLMQRGALQSLLSFKRGDPSMGIITGMGMLAAGWLVRSAAIPPSSPQHGWLFNIYTQIGDVEGAPALTAMLLAMVLMEELIWRGWVLQELTEHVGLRKAFPLSAVLYAAAQAPTLFTLADDAAGLNPLLVLAALGAGIIWSYLTVSSGRLWPAVFSHAMFSYFGAAWLVGPPNMQSGFFLP